MPLTKVKRSNSFLIQYVYNRVIERNKNFLAVITGPTGSGKSYSAVRLAELGDPDFDVNNIVFNPQQFMTLVNGKVKKLKRGSWIVFDEIQVSMSHLDALTMQAKLINFVLQTFRHRNLVVIMTAPHFDFINASIRKLVHCRIETCGINPYEKTCRLKVKMIQVNQQMGKIYEKFLRVETRPGIFVPMKYVMMNLPSRELLKEYEDKKSRFTRDLNQEIQWELELQSIKRENKLVTKTEQLERARRAAHSSTRNPVGERVSAHNRG